MAQTRPMQMGPVPAPRDPGMGGRVLLGPMPAPGAQGGTGTGAGRPLPHVRRTRVQARPGTRARLLLRPVPQQVEPAHPHRDKCHECGARLDTGTRGEYCGDACRKAHDYKTARDRRMLRSAANAGTIERLRMNADDLLTRAHAIELDTETIWRHGIETRARTHILLMRMLTLAAAHDPRSLTQAGPDGQIGRIIDACDRTGEDGDAERLLRRHGPACGAAGKGEEHAWPSA